MDTHVLLWWLGNDAQLGTEARRLLRDAPHVFVSPVSPWEIEIKRSNGKLSVPDDYAEAIAGSGFEWLSITAGHAIAAGRLPRHHGDPFDRMLVAQARAEHLSLMSADEQLREYDVALVSARR